MTGNMLRWELNAFVGFIERQKNLYRRYWAWEAVWLLYNLVSVLSIGYLAAGLSTLGLEQGQANLHQTQLYLLVGALLWTYLSLLFISGVYYPITVLPAPLRLAGMVSPLTYTLDGVREALLHGLPLPNALPYIGTLLLMGVILVPASVWCFGRAEIRAKRLGLLKRSG